MISTSVPQKAQASIRSKTSAAPGSGTVFSVSLSCSGPSRTQAFIVAGTVNPRLSTVLAIAVFIATLQYKFETVPKVTRRQGQAAHPSQRFIRLLSGADRLFARH
jgi:hypothetical protein